MRMSMENQLKLFKLIGGTLKEKVECVVIGGSAMMFYNCKESTKDVDLVSLNKKNFKLLRDALFDIGFKLRSFRLKYQDLSEEEPIFLENKEEQRVDLFIKEVICFELSDAMLSRIKEAHEFNNLIVKVVAPEDIILLKCATERPGDRLDAVELIKGFTINWDIIVDEAKKQSRLGRGIFSVFLYDFLMELKEDFKVEVPKEVLDKLMDIGEEAILKAVKDGTLVREDRTKKRLAVGDGKRRKAK